VTERRTTRFIEDRHGAGATPITSQFLSVPGHDRRSATFGDAILKRLVHNAFQSWV
jgi:hypothetical protein